jgi:DNA helicase HerA-like ATPase
MTQPPRPAAVIGPAEEIGTIYGNVGTASFNCRVTAHVERAEYVMVEHADYGNVLCQIGNLIRKTDLSLEKSATVTKDTKIDEMISATVDVIGYRDDRGLLQSPRTTFHAGAPVKRASGALIQKVLGLKAGSKVGAYIGLLHGHDIPVALDINELLARHACVLAKTGGGKSYISGDVVEELMKHNVTCMIIDPHGEYGAMREKGKPGDARFGVAVRGYADSILEFSVSKEIKSANPLRFTLRSLEAREILELTRTNDVKTFLPSLRKAIDLLREKQDVYSVRELIDTLMNDGDGRNSVLIAELEYLEEIGLFATRGNRINELIMEGKTSLINLKGVPPDIQELVVRRLSTLLFEMRKVGGVPPMMLILEEAHNYCPQQGTALSSKALSTIASEGRKFGLGLMVISQRPAKIDKNVLSQCGTQIILKLTNPNDLKAVAASVEGLTNGMIDEVQTMPIGMAMVVGAGIEAPLLVDVRPRESRHGGAGVTVLKDEDD